MYDGNPGEIYFGSSQSARFDLARVRVIESRLYTKVVELLARPVVTKYRVTPAVLNT